MQAVAKKIEKYPIIIFLLLGFAVYFPVLTNGFLGDDFGQIVDNAIVHSIANFPMFFKGSTFFANGVPNLFGIYYKPLLSISYSTIYTVFGPNPFVFHLIQLLVHVSNSFLVFKILSKFFKTRPSFLAGMLFLIHPINAETVAYIANYQDILFLFFGLLAVFLMQKKGSKLRGWTVIGLCLFLSLLSKETGILFIVVTFIYTVIFSKKYLIHQISVSALVIGLYGFLRFAVAGIKIGHGNFTPIEQTPLPLRLANIPGIVFYYFKILFFPKDLYIYNHHLIKSPGFSNFYMPLLLIVVFVSILIVTGLELRKRDSAKFICFSFFVLWFLAGMLFHLQIFPLDSITADRWFYFPFIGLLGMVLTSIGLLPKSKYSRYLLPVLAILFVMFSIRTSIRVADFKNPYILATHDVKVNTDSPELEGILGNELYIKGKYTEAITHLEKSVRLFAGNGVIWYNLALPYQKLKMTDKAIAAYQKSVSVAHYFGAYENLSDLYLRQKNWGDAIKISDEGLKLYPLNSKLMVTNSVAYYLAGDQTEALLSARRLYSLYPTTYNKGLLDYIETKKPINIENSD